MSHQAYRHRVPLRTAMLSAALFAALATAARAAPAELWTDLPPVTGAATTARGVSKSDLPSRYRRVSLATAELGAYAVTRRGQGAAQPDAIDLPLPDGGTSRFVLADSGVIPPALAARFPGLRSLVGRDDQGRVARIDVNTAGAIDAQVSDAAGTWIVRPEHTLARGASARRSDVRNSHLVFRRADAPRTAVFHEPTPPGEDPSSADNQVSTAKARAARSTAHAAGQRLRTFRIAMSASSAYVAKMGGTVEDGLAGVMKVVNRLNAIYGNDLGVRFQLAENNDRIIFADPASDPFADLDDDLKLALRNASVAADRLGRDAYDVGHLVHATPGNINAGIAGRIGNTCLNAARPVTVSATTPVTGADFTVGGADKAAGMTGSHNPFGDAFHVDYVAHELGHQFGARHTFNVAHKARDNGGAVAPGSGSTIMGYAGLTDADLQAQTDAYFHGHSIEQIAGWLASAGGACAATRSNPLPTPWLDDDYPNYVVVPAKTPFFLEGLLRFAQPGAVPTYTFEQIDRGPAQTNALHADDGMGPLFRSRPPHAENWQAFPSMKVLLGKEPLAVGDAFPSMRRSLNFRLTARDNLDPMAHVVSHDIAVQVVDTGAAFEVLTPAAATTVKRGATRAITWRVASTNKPPLSCKNVDIRLSTDGGETFGETPLLQGVPNTGRARVTVPADAPATMRGRLRIDCTTEQRPFFALSPGDFRIR